MVHLEICPSALGRDSQLFDDENDLVALAPVDTVGGKGHHQDPLYQLARDEGLRDFDDASPVC